MAIAKRLFLFLLTNILVMATISILLNVLGVRPYLTSQGIDYQSLMLFCLIWGFGGAFISLAMSRWMAKMAMGIKVIDPKHPGDYAWLMNTMDQLSKAAGLPVTPEIGVYGSPEINAFATGPSKRRALVAFSAGLLQRMNRDEIEGVAAHELAHVANGDMVTMTLLQGVINAFVMFFARVIAFAISNATRSQDDEAPNHGMQYLVTFLLEIVLGVLGMMVVAWFSRRREFKADKGGAAYAGRSNMVSALKRLQQYAEVVDPNAQAPSIQAMKISNNTGGLMKLFSTHPPLAVRIAALEGSGSQDFQRAA